jgi:hypothetical protein
MYQQLGEENKNKHLPIYTSRLILGLKTDEQIVNPPLKTTLKENKNKNLPNKGYHFILFLNNILCIYVNFFDDQVGNFSSERGRICNKQRKR